MKKNLRNFFGSYGTLFGYLGSLSLKGLPEIFSKWVLINLSNPLRHPVPLVDPLLTKNLNTAGPWCDCIWKRIILLLRNIWAMSMCDITHMSRQYCTATYNYNYGADVYFIITKIIKQSCLIQLVIEKRNTIKVFFTVPDSWHVEPI